MEWSEYVEKSARTWNTDDGLRLQLCNATLGLNGEIPEFEDTPEREELGDVLFYLATLSRLTGIEVSRQDPCILSTGMILKCTEEMPFATDNHAGKLAELIKKAVFHDDLLDDMADDICSLFEAIMVWAEAHCEDKGWAFEQVLEDNYQKLAERYPNGFDPERK